MKKTVAMTTATHTSLQSQLVDRKLLPNMFKAARQKQ